MEKHLLINKQVLACNSLAKWKLWMTNADRTVAQDSIGGVRISTVFLGINHQFGSGPPLLFETVVFGGSYDGECRRYSTWKEAEEGHKKMVEKIKANLIKKD